MVNQILDRRTVAMPGGKGDTGDVTPELEGARDEAVAARADAVAARNQAEVFAAGTVAMQDTAIATALRTEGSQSGGALTATVAAASAASTVVGSSQLAADYSYARIDMGVSVLGQASDGVLYGVMVSNGHWATSTDSGTTWVDRTSSPSALTPGAYQLVVIGDFMFVGCSGGKVFRAPKGVFSTWTEMTPADIPAGTTGRPDNISTDGTVLMLGNYNTAALYEQHARVWRCANPVAATPTWEVALSVPDARHIHSVRPDPYVPGAWWVAVGDSPQPGCGLYRSPTGLAGSFVKVASNRYPINLAFPPPPTVPGLPSWVLGEGDGQNEPHLFAFRRDTLPFGPMEGLAKPATEWRGTARGLYVGADGNAFWISTAEGGAVGTKDGIWTARGPYFSSPVLLEELSPPLVNYGKTYESGGYLINYRYRFPKPAFRTKALPTAAPVHAAPAYGGEGMSLPIPSRLGPTSAPFEYPLGITSGLVSVGWPVEGIMTTSRDGIRATQQIVSIGTTLNAVPVIYVRSTFRPAGSDPTWGSWRLMPLGLVGGSLALAAAQDIPNAAQTAVPLAGIRFQLPSNMTWLGVGANAGKIVVPVGAGGHYDLKAQLTWVAAASAAGFREVSIRVNGTPLLVGSVSGSTGIITSDCDTTALLAEGDVVEMWCFQLSGAPLAVKNGSTSTFLTVRRVGLV